MEAAARARDARVLLLAADAAENTRRRCEHFAQAGDCLWLRIPFTKAELGRALGRTAVAIAAVTDVGLAAALLHRLAELDPEQYARRGGADGREGPPGRGAPGGAGRPTRRISAGASGARRRRPSQTARPPAGRPPPERAAGRRDRPRGARPNRPRPPRDARPKPKAKARPYAHSRPVKKGKGSFRKKKEG